MMLFPLENPMKLVFNVQGMTCGHCEKAVISAVRQVDPAAEVRVNRSQNQVEVQTEQPREAVAAAIREEGYAVGA
jgi:copper chaperone